jgi:hypothetical protein
MYALLYFTGLKLTCGIRAIFFFRGMPLLLRVWLGLDRSSLSWVCDKPRFSGRFCSGDSSVERGMESSSRIDIEKFNGKNFELWKLKMEDLLVDKEQWIIVDPGTQPMLRTNTRYEDIITTNTEYTIYPQRKIEETTLFI